MWFKKQDDLQLPKLPPEKKEKNVLNLNLSRSGLKKLDVPRYGKEPELLHRIDLGEKVKKIEPEFYFWLCNGRIIKDLNELTKAMKSMDENTFRFHVTDYKNDFSNWIRDIVKNEKLANELLKVKNQDQAYEVLSGKTLKKKKPRKPKPSTEPLPEPPKIPEPAATPESSEVPETSESIETPTPPQSLDTPKTTKPAEALRTGAPIPEAEALPELHGLDALKTEEEAFEKIEDVIDHPEARLPYQGKVIPKPKTRAVRKPAKPKQPKAVEKKVRKPKLKGVAKINKITEEAEHLMNSGDAQSAKELANKARDLLRRASMPKQEKNSLSYRLIDLEAKAKLIMMS